ncbi:hypothetical protein DID88_010467 [Monilinia fructigena]|uniref:Rhodopsin domain-containing protein n=1 Tax=Monilinia fructigena TaxID=38457 RepID=A0A395INI0_9HELO|nr:hypothetical protein DID88_010467 [Monilinia fructigena]
MRVTTDDWWILIGLLLLIITGAVLLYGVKSDPNGGETINRDSPTFDYTPHVVLSLDYRCPIARKILVGGIFLLGSFVVITGVVRVVLGYAPGSQNVDFPRAELWSTVHVGMAILVDCMDPPITSDRDPNASGSSGSRSGVSKHKNAAELMALGNIRRPKPDELEDTNADTRRLTRNGSEDLESYNHTESGAGG